MHALFPRSISTRWMSGIRVPRFSSSVASSSQLAESPFFANELNIDLQLHSLVVPNAKSSTLGLVQLKANNLDVSTAPVVMFVAGAISNGKMFWSSKGKGLAVYLAKQGVNVFVTDRRGIGYSKPSLKEEAAAGTIIHGQLETIRDDLPLLATAVSALSQRTDGRQTWISHSWGGVLLSSMLAREHAALSQGNVHVDSMVCFGTKKYIGEKNSWEYFKGIVVGWNFLCPILARYYGYLPAKKIGVGSDDETINFLRDCTKWVQDENLWIDPVDGFDYQTAWNDLDYRPPVWHICASHDAYLGNPRDVQRWANLTGQIQRFSELSREKGSPEDYNHLSMLTSKHAVTDIFPRVFEWLQEHQKKM